MQSSNAIDHNIFQAMLRDGQQHGGEKGEGKSRVNLVSPPLSRYDRGFNRDHKGNVLANKYAIQEAQLREREMKEQQRMQLMIGQPSFEKQAQKGKGVGPFDRKV